MTDAETILNEARARAEARASARVPIDYNESNKMFRAQKAALTRAINSGDPDKVVGACKKAKDEWSRHPFNGAWPDDWSRWQRALDDVLPWNAPVDLADL